MLIRKNVSLDEVHLEQLQPFLDKNGGNLSAAVREAIELASFALESYGSPEEAAGALKTKEKEMNTRKKLLKSGEYLLLNRGTVNWLVKCASGRLIDDDIVYELINPYRVNTIPDLIKYINDWSQLMDWKIRVSLTEGEEEIEPECGALHFYGGDPGFRELIVKTVSVFMGRWMGLDVDSVYRKAASLTVYFKKFIQEDSWEVPPGVLKHFGSRDSAYREIERKPEYWTTLIELYRISSYQRINIDRGLFEAFAAGDVPDIRKYFENRVGRPLHEVPLQDLIPLFKKLIEVTQLTDEMEVSTEVGKEYIKIRHSYSSETLIFKIVWLFSDVFKAGWHTFNVKSLSNLIIFNFGKSRVARLKETVYSMSADGVDFGYPLREEP
ncbi:MAG: hypothetical protein PHV51_04170 [Methanosarcinaceae archaeon]|nr:hypothetical protein [Methanosarcinaceae archaeon]MDD4497333.1 hypothetical protein [Methanosarcinaceae archaeon]